MSAHARWLVGVSSLEVKLASTAAAASTCCGASTAAAALESPLSTTTLFSLWRRPRRCFCCNCGCRGSFCTLLVSGCSPADGCWVRVGGTNTRFRLAYRIRRTSSAIVSSLTTANTLTLHTVTHTLLFVCGRAGKVDCQLAFVFLSWCFIVFPPKWPNFVHTHTHTRRGQQQCYTLSCRLFHCTV